MLRPPKKDISRDAKMESNTTNRRDYVAHPVTPPMKRPPAQFQPPEVEMDTKTMYNNDYSGKWQAPRKPIFNSGQWQEHKEPFDHNTTHATDYAAPPVTPRDVHTAQYDYEPPKTPFDDNTTARSDFVHHGKVPVAASLAPLVSVSERTQPVQGATSYNTTFTTPKMPEKFEKRRAIYAPPKEKVSDLTTFKCSFPQHPAAKPREGKKPVSERCNTDLPLESRTINRMHYKAWDLPKRTSRPPTAFVPPTEKVSDDTTHKSDFADYGRVPLTPSSKPLHKANNRIDPFDSLTTNNVDYKAWDGVTRPEQVRRDKEYEPPQERFDPATTFSSDFRGTFTSRPPLTKPSPNPPSTGKIDFTTSYKNYFSGPGYRPCRSIPLLVDDTKASQYVFSHEDTSGHKFYTPTKGLV
jgi:hypothetical protein